MAFRDGNTDIDKHKKKEVKNGMIMALFFLPVNGINKLIYM